MGSRPEPSSKPWIPESQTTEQGWRNEHKHIHQSYTWRKLAKRHKKENPLCVMCEAEGKATKVYATDHIISLADGGDPFAWDNCQSLCKTHHTDKTKREAVRAYKKIKTVPLEEKIINIIYGPPASGKTSYVMSHRQKGDLILDQDKLFQALSFEPMYEKPEQLTDTVLDTFQFLISYIEKSGTAQRVWIVTTSKNAAALVGKLQGTLIAAPCMEYEQCYNNIMRDSNRKNKQQHIKHLRKWFDK